DRDETLEFLAKAEDIDLARFVIEDPQLSTSEAAELEEERSKLSIEVLAFLEKMKANCQIEDPTEKTATNKSQTTTSWLASITGAPPACPAEYSDQNVTIINEESRDSSGNINLSIRTNVTTKYSNLDQELIDLTEFKSLNSRSSSTGNSHI